ncbi:MAG TPA: hypothetical protein VNN25_00955 [Thermoanaerobaculia bacterium]|nr:hypothetical protein [Thermoanaerobaculia bacterium]
MSDSTFNVSKDSIQISYRRFLSESAAGFVLILLFAASYYYPVFTRYSLRASFGGDPHIGSETKVFVFVTLFLLATPLGYAVNAFSWLLFSQVQTALETFFCRPGTHRIFPILSNFEARHVSPIMKELGIDDATFATMNWFLRTSLENPHLEKLIAETSVRNLVIFLRNTALFLVSGGLIALYSAQRTGLAKAWCAAIMLLIAFALTTTWTYKPIARILAIGGVFGVGALVYVASDLELAARASFLIVTSVVVVLIAGVIGYYNCCAILLHTHLARAAVGVGTAASSDNVNKPFGIITALVTEAAKLERERKI